MDFSIEQFGGNKTRYVDSGTDSPIQIVFLPGAFNAEIWKHQLNYFSSSFRTITYSVEDRDYTTQKEILEGILEQEELRNVVLVSHGIGNRLAQQLEYREEVIATVMTGPTRKPPRLPRRLHNFSTGMLNHGPKLFKKLFLSGMTDYRVARQLIDDIEMPSYGEYTSFTGGYSLRKPVKKSLIIHPQDDRFSSLEDAKSLKPNASVSVIRDAGSFSFYEKPQEYNKAVLDFLRTLQDFVQSREVSRSRQKNRSLKDFAEVPKQR